MVPRTPLASSKSVITTTYSVAPHGPHAVSEPPHGAPPTPQPPHGAVSSRGSLDESGVATQLHPAAPVPSIPDSVSGCNPMTGTAHQLVRALRTRCSIPTQRVALSGHSACNCRDSGLPARRRSTPTVSTTQALARHVETRAGLWDRIRMRNIESALAQAGLALPTSPSSSDSGVPSLNKPLQSVLSEFVRRTRMPLPRFIELLRDQTLSDYRPNKHLLPDVLHHTRRGYQHLDALIEIARSGVRAPLSKPMPTQRSYPANHKSADDRYAVLVKDIRKEQDNWRCIVGDIDILEIWPEVHTSPFGVVDKGDEDPLVSGRVIRDLSYPEGQSLNDRTDTSRICTPTLEHCDAIASEVIRQQHDFPEAEVQLQAGDVASAFRNVCTHSESAHLFGGRLERDSALVIDSAAAFGWSGSLGSYGVVGGAIAYLHGNSINEFQPAGLFNSYWVDDHINVAADVGSNCCNAEQSLRHSMITVLGPGAVNEKKLTSWNSRQKVLGLIFDTVTGTVAMPVNKIEKARKCVATALSAKSLNRPE